MIGERLKQRFKISTGLRRVGGGTGSAYRKVLPFKRAWVAIVFIAFMDAAFLIPAVLTFGQAAQSWSRMESLFDLVAAVFLTAWLLGWSMAPLLMTFLLVMMLLGREVIRARPGTLEIFIGLPLLGLAESFSVAKMRNLRIEEPARKSGKSWRGPHLAFDYEGRSIAFGSQLDSHQAGRIRKEVERASRSVVRDGAPPADAGSEKGTAEAAATPPAAAAIAAIAATPGGGVQLMSLSSAALVAANLIPVGGTLLLGWELSDIMMLYWAESAVIGFYNLLKIVVIARWGALLAGPFFVGHFGAFMAVHFLFIHTLFVEGISGGDSNGNNLAAVAALFSNLWPALAALFLSHGLSFVINFLGRREYRGRIARDQMSEPYTRIIFMHLVLIFGGGLTLLLGSPTPVLLIVIALKIVFDVRAHLGEHRNTPDAASKRSPDQ